MNLFSFQLEAPWGRWMRRAIVVLVAGRLAGPAGADSIVNSKHNLSVSGPGSIRAATETEVCIFCHTPHNATSEAPLWNRFSSGALYIPYSSSTAKASVGQPTGASKLCLSCHDGTVALGLVRSRASEIEFLGGVYNMPPGPSRLGNDLSDDHPVSFRYDHTLAGQNGQLVEPATLLGEVRLDKQQELQCTSCHDPHDDRFGKFLVRDNFASGLCLECHQVTYWNESIHRTSPATWNGTGLDPWPHTEQVTVEANACESCHAPHSAGTHPRLLNYAGEEQNCYACHNGNVAGQDIQAEFSKPSAHDVSRTVGVHDPTENLVNPPRHVECVDCHNPHAAAAEAVSGDLAGALRGVAGINSAGTVVAPIQHEYELCFRCHADSVDRGPAVVNRQYPQTNTRLAFDPGNDSFHPVLALGRNPDVPSLIDPYRTSSLISCTDCHNNDGGPGAGGSGPRGPHGSTFRPLLERQVEFADGMGDDLTGAALCYKCHSRDSVLADESFTEHRRHIGKGFACTTCHDPHGVAQNTHLINFNPDYVKPFDGKVEFVDDGKFAGNCTLTCHGEDHDALAYPESEARIESVLRRRTLH